MAESEQGKVRAHLFVSGWVQGVFFRANTRDMALRYGVKGWVRNLPDGRVEVLCEGDKEGVDSLIEWCRKGPPGAMVEDVEVNREEYKGEFENFSIHYF